MASTKRDELTIRRTAVVSPICKITFCKRKDCFTYLYIYIYIYIYYSLEAYRILLNAVLLIVVRDVITLDLNQTDEATQVVAFSPYAPVAVNQC